MVVQASSASYRGWHNGKENVMAIESVNPATGRRIKVYEEMGPREVERILELVHGAFLWWWRMSLAEWVA